VFLDGDVYLTGTRNPFAEMLPLSNETWDIQYQRDWWPPADDLNIGWYFARASSNTIDYFKRSFARWNETGGWDQAVMNDIAREMENKTLVEAHNGTTLMVHRLDMTTFRNFMHTSWHGLFRSEQEAAAYINESTMIHFTCVEQSLKTYMGLYFGGFADVDGYYSNAPLLMRVINIAGTSDAVHRQVAFALQLAAATGRTLIWPNTVTVLQRKMDEEKAEEKEEEEEEEREEENEEEKEEEKEEENAKDKGEEKEKEKREEEKEGEEQENDEDNENEEKEYYVLLEKYPSILVVNFDMAQTAGFSVVEGRYLQNRQRYKEDNQEEITIMVKWLEIFSVVEFEHLILSLREDVLPVLDFANFGTEWLIPDNPEKAGRAVLNAYVKQAAATFDIAYHDSGMQAYSKDALKKAPLCINADGDGHCLYQCQG
jgi:hypothetical protein